MLFWGKAMQERVYQARLIKKLRLMFDGCYILKNDSSYLQGVPDLIILFGPYWAMLEVKVSADAGFQPNQQYYISELNDMGFAAVIFPENEEAVLRELQQALDPRRAARVPKR
jgi:hypothetical protein